MGTVPRTEVIQTTTKTTSSVQYHSSLNSFPEQAFQGVLVTNDSRQGCQDERSKKEQNCYPVLPRKTLSESCGELSPNTSPRHITLS